MKIPRAAYAVPAVVLVAACGAAATTARDDKAESSSVSGSAVAAPKALSPNAPDLSMSTGRDAATLGDLTSTTAGTTATGEEVSDQTEPTQTKAVISKGKISLRTTNVEDERFKLKQYLDDWDGTIANEESDADAKGRTSHEHLELRVPAGKFDVAMDKLSTLGTLIDRTRTSTDVTTKVIDNAVRVRTQKLSLARIQALLDQATSLNQIISIESQLSRRQAELDSLEQQQKYLADQTSQSTINVYFTVATKHVAAKKKHHDDNGFVAGLRGGWNNLGHATNTVLHAVGGVLPFGAVLLVVGIPVWAARRRRGAAVQAG